MGFGRGWKVDRRGCAPYVVYMNNDKTPPTYPPIREYTDEELVNIGRGIKDIVVVQDRLLAQGIKPLEMNQDDLRRLYLAENALSDGSGR